MKKYYEFETDIQSQSFCRLIVLDMIDRFDIDEAEALGRVNRHWRGQNLTGEDLLIYHREVDFWSRDIYYGGDSGWWLKPPGLKPRPYP